LIDIPVIRRVKLLL